MLDPRTVARSLQDYTRAPFTRIPQAARDAWLRALEQVRVTLDLPSRRELAELTTRLEALDARIVAMAAAQIAGKTLATLPAATEPDVEPLAAADADPTAGAGAAADPAAAAAGSAVAADTADSDADADADSDSDDDADPATITAEAALLAEAAAATDGVETVVGTNGVSSQRRKKARKNNRR